MKVQDSALLRGVVGLIAIAVAVGSWSGCPGDGGDGDGGHDSGHEHENDAGMDSGHGGDAGADGGGGGSDAGTDAGGDPEPSLSASDQTLTLSTEVTIDSVTATASSWVVVTATLTDGGLASGAAQVGTGTATGLKVAVGDPLEDGTSVSAGLYVDLGVAGAFEPGIDPQAMSGGLPVGAQFQVTVPEGTPAVSYAFQPQCQPSPCVWRVSSVTPLRFADTLSTTDPNPAITLYAGWRYQVTNTFFDFHPFDLIDTSSGSDVVLLTQDADAGTLRTDPTIAWVDGRSTSGVSRFTLSPSLQAELTDYRCRRHASSMRAPVTIQTR